MSRLDEVESERLKPVLFAAALGRDKICDTLNHGKAKPQARRHVGSGWRFNIPKRCHDLKTPR